MKLSILTPAEVIRYRTRVTYEARVHGVNPYILKRAYRAGVTVGELEYLSELGVKPELLFYAMSRRFGRYAQPAHIFPLLYMKVPIQQIRMTLSANPEAFSKNPFIAYAIAELGASPLIYYSGLAPAVARIESLAELEDLVESGVDMWRFTIASKPVKRKFRPSLKYAYRKGAEGKEIEMTNKYYRKKANQLYVYRFIIFTIFKKSPIVTFDEALEVAQNPTVDPYLYARLRKSKVLHGQALEASKGDALHIDESTKSIKTIIRYSVHNLKNFFKAKLYKLHHKTK